jgi:hypothetical protein
MLNSQSSNLSPDSFYVEKQVNATIINPNSALYYSNFISIGKAEASSAGEQLARNSLFDWNGQRRSGLLESWPFVFSGSFHEPMPVKNSFFNNSYKNNLLLTVQTPAIQYFNFYKG